MNIKEKVSQLIELRKNIDEIKKSIEPIKKQKELLQAEIIKDMKEQDFKSVKTEEATVSIKQTKTMRITDEKMVISVLKEKGLNDYIVEAIDKDLFKGFSAEAIKQGMPIMGTEIRETEFISITKSSNAKEDNTND